MSITFLLLLDHYFLKNEKKYTWVFRKLSRSVSGAPTVYLSEFWLVENFGELWRHNVPVEGFNMYTRARIPSKTYIAGLWSLGNPTISKNILGTTHYEASLLSFHFSRYSWRCMEYPYACVAWLFLLQNTMLKAAVVPHPTLDPYHYSLYWIYSFPPFT